MKSIFNSASAANFLEQAFSDVLKAVVIEETALSNILNFENDLIKKGKKDAANLEEFVALNESINNMMRNITKVKLLTQIKLQNLRKLIETMGDINHQKPLEEKT
ncbi:MAG TPA: hypothetical protein VHY08_02805 [Bacillota bacterium]|nr:hypothetical protein [Bacillota bacterium]